MRWRIECADQDLKQDLGLGQYEGRGSHHHASLSIAAYGFLLLQRLQHPEEVGGKNSARREPAPPHALHTSGEPGRRGATPHTPSRACDCLSTLCWLITYLNFPVIFGINNYQTCSTVRLGECSQIEAAFRPSFFEKELRVHDFKPCDLEMDG